MIYFLYSSGWNGIDIQLYRNLWPKDKPCHQPSGGHSIWDGWLWSVQIVLQMGMVNGFHYDGDELGLGPWSNDWGNEYWPTCTWVCPNKWEHDDKPVEVSVCFCVFSPNMFNRVLGSVWIYLFCVIFYEPCGCKINTSWCKNSRGPLSDNPVVHPCTLYCETIPPHQPMWTQQKQIKSNQRIHSNEFNAASRSYPMWIFVVYKGYG
jgi:hypothetical protein